jgi:hypothetical protein
MAADTFTARYENMLARQAAGCPADLAMMLMTSENDFDYKGEQLVEQANYIIRRLEGVIRHVEGGYHVSSSGEIQGSGAKFDILCAERQMVAENVKRLTYLADKLTPAPKARLTYLEATEHMAGHTRFQEGCPSCETIHRGDVDQPEPEPKAHRRTRPRPARELVETAG